MRHLEAKEATQAGQGPAAERNRSPKESVEAQSLEFTGRKLDETY